MEEELPKSFLSGEEFINDKNKVNVNFEFFFNSPALIQPNIFDANDCTVLIEQKNGILRVKFSYNVSERLRNSWFSGDSKSIDWIIGYVAEILPFLNQELLRQRYQLGHFLMKTYSVFDIKEIRIIDIGIKKIIRINGPGPMSEFPSMAEFGKEFSDRSYIKDLIDVGNSYLNFNFEDCIRRIITSLETFFKYHKLRRIPKTKSGFIDLVNQYLNFTCEMSGELVSKQLIDIYIIRNKIVHEGKRYSVIELEKIAKKAIHFLLDAYKFYGSDDELHQYILNLEMQFIAHLQIVGHGITLKVLANIKDFENEDNL